MDNSYYHGDYTILFNLTPNYFLIADSTVVQGQNNQNRQKGLYDVKYDDDDTDKGLKRIAIRRYIPLKKGEIVKSKVIAKNGDDLWILSVITKVNNDGTVNVKHFDGEKLESLPAGIFVQRFDWRYQKGS